MTEVRQPVSYWACVIYACTDLLAFPWLGFEGLLYSTFIGFLVIAVLRWRAVHAWRIPLISLLGIMFCIYPTILELVLWMWRQRLADHDASKNILDFLHDLQPYSGLIFFRAIVFGGVTALITQVSAMRVPASR
jgi:hypothetical protein